MSIHATIQDMVNLIGEYRFYVYSQDAHRKQGYVSRVLN